MAKMRIAIIGGAGAMGSVLGGQLALSGVDVTLLDVSEAAVETINKNGLRVDDKSGETRTIPIRASTNPAEIGPVDLALVFVKCYHTESAVRAAAPLIGAQTVILSLQNGWGNAPRIAGIVGEERVVAGVTYHSATVLAPGHIQHSGRGMTFIGELDGHITGRVQQIAEIFNTAGIEMTVTDDVLKAIWSKLALNVCTLPTSALLRFYAGQLIQHTGTLELMQALLREVMSVANAQNIALEFDERWEAITGLLSRASGAKASMLQDVENRRRTEIDVINGAIVEAGQRLNIPTPYNQAMVWLVKALEETFAVSG
jgi:2-dehydropantoate 2-reductase